MSICVLAIFHENSLAHALRLRFVPLTSYTKSLTKNSKRTRLPEVVFNLWSPYLYHLSVLASLRMQNKNRNKVNRQRIKRNENSWCLLHFKSRDRRRYAIEERDKKKTKYTTITLPLRILLLLMMLDFKYCYCCCCSTCLLDVYELPFRFVVFSNVQTHSNSKSHYSYRPP